MCPVHIVAISGSKIAIRLPPLPSIRDILKLYKLRAIKHLAQNFLMDYKLTSKIAKAAGNINDFYVCEVGPGPGGITRSILERGAKKVILIEKDKRFTSTINMLSQACPGKIEVYWGDVLSFNMSEMFPQELKQEWVDSPPRIHIIGNLPFNISTPLIIRWMKAISERNNVWKYGRVPLTLTFQKEVAIRLAAEVADEQRCRLSVMNQYLCHTFHKFDIPGSAFVPKPDVDVGVVKFIPRKEPLINQPFDLVEKVVRETFSMRQKYCRRGASTLFPEYVRDTLTPQLFSKADVNPETRPFQLTIDEFSRLCDAYAKICEEYPEVRDYHYRGHRPDRDWEFKYASGSKYVPFSKEFEFPSEENLDCKSIENWESIRIGNNNSL